METKQLEIAISSAILEQEITLPEGRKEELFDNIYNTLRLKKEEFITLQSRINQKAQRASLPSTQIEVIKKINTKR
jgi:phosphotransacetylase